MARQREQENRLGGIVYTPETTPSNHLVDLYVEMLESGILAYVKLERCCSRAQEVSAIRKDPTVSTDASGLEAGHQSSRAELRHKFRDQAEVGLAEAQSCNGFGRDCNVYSG